MIKSFTLICRKAGLDHEAFGAYWRDVHARVVMSAVDVRPLRYVQNHLQSAAPVYPGGAAVDGVAESWRRSIADLPKPLHQNPYWLKVVRPDEERFISVVDTSNVIGEELVLRDGAASAYKLIVFAAVAELPREAIENATRHVSNPTTPQRQQRFDGEPPARIWTSVEEIWHPTEAERMTALALLARCDDAQSFVALPVTEHVIHDARSDGAQR